MNELYDKLNKIVDDAFTPEEDRRAAAEILRNLQLYLTNAFSTSYPADTLEEPQPEKPDAEPLVFSHAQAALVEKLGEDRELDRKEVHLGEVLSSKGAFGVVYKGTYCGTSVAVKELRDDHDPGQSKSFRMEGKGLSLLHHPFICEYMGHMENPYSIVTRLYPRDLTNALKQRDASGKPVLTREDKFRIAYQLAAALLYLHKNGILHRDVKTDNILLDENNNVKLADFGLSEYAPGTVYDKGEAVGTFFYMAPEVIHGCKFDAKCEVYTYGLMLYEIFTGRLAFDGLETVGELLEKQELAEPLPVTEADWSKTGANSLPPLELWEFAKRCWSFDPKDRPSMEEVVSEIVKIGIKAAIPRSGTAENFWLSCSSFVYRDHLLLPELVKRCVKADWIDLETLITEAVPKSWNLISITDYWLLCCWYPNFFVSRESQKDMKQTVESDWYAPDEAEVKARVGDPMRQLFVIRPSSTNSFEQPFTLCASVRGNTTYHRITRFYDATNRCPMFLCDTLIPGKHFSSICDLAEFVKTELHLSPAAVRLQQVYAQPTK